MPDPTPAAPAVPAIPVGLGTFVGLGAGTAQWVAAILAFIDGDHTATTITLVVMGALTVITTLIGRFAQAKAHIDALPQLASVAAYAVLPEATVGPDPVEAELGQTDPDEDLVVHDGDVPPDEGDVGEAGAVA